MVNYKKLILLFYVIVLISVMKLEAKAISFQVTDSIKLELSADETILFNMINDIRLQNKMSVIPLSDKLCFVARIHIDDLIRSKPSATECGLHSWSENGHWSSCCHTKDPSGIKCMKSKPNELTGYSGNGYELIYSADDKALPSEAADLWKQVDASLSMILCKGKWKGYQWKMMGVGIMEGYALLWFGDKFETASEILTLPLNAGLTGTNQQNAPESKTASFAQNKNLIADEKQAKQNNSQPVKAKEGFTYFLIVASLKSAEAAQSELKAIKQKGNPEAIILEADGVFRISVASFDSEKQAKKKLGEIKNEFPGIWIFKQ
jgi:hypothetical protein